MPAPLLHLLPFPLDPSFPSLPAAVSSRRRRNMQSPPRPITADALDTSPHHPDEDLDLDLEPEHAEKQRILQRWLQRIFATFLGQLTPKRWWSGWWIRGWARVGGGRMGYARLGPSRRRKERAKLGGGLMRIRIWRRRRFFIRSSPRALLAGLRDAYVRLLLAAESRMALCAPHGSLSMGPFAASSYTPYFPPSLPKEYDPKILLQLYAKSLQPPLNTTTTTD